ncbi:MAG: hypothetical protein HPY57_13810 [Ignavibacteria bacterium]|nr:hypothetical protein [Ignavibacteria bacterium]
MKYYDHGWCWIYAETYEEYKEKPRQFKPYYVWDLESLEKYHKLRTNPSDDITEFMWANGNKKYITKNDYWKITTKEYLNTIRQNKLKRILK